MLERRSGSAAGGGGGEHRAEGLRPKTLRYLLYRVLEPLGPYIVGIWGVRAKA